MKSAKMEIIFWNFGENQLTFHQIEKNTFY